MRFFVLEFTPVNEVLGTKNDMCQKYNLLSMIPKTFSKLDNRLSNPVFKRKILPISSQRGLTKSHSQKI